MLLKEPHTNCFNSTGQPKFLSAPKHQQYAIEIRVGGQHPLVIEVQRRYGGKIDRFHHNEPGSIIRVENVNFGTDVSYVHISNDFGRVSSDVTTVLVSKFEHVPNELLP